MKAALDEQGFKAKSKKDNRLVAWEDSELKAMEMILKNHGLTREIKNATYEHRTLEEQYIYEDEKKITGDTWAKVMGDDVTLTQAKHEINMLKNEQKKLTEQIKSPWKSFYYSSDDKQAFVQNRLDELQIPYRETDNGFEAQDCYVEEIRKVEKMYRAKENPHREELRNNLDKFVMQSQSFDEVITRLKQAGYEVNENKKYISVKPRYGTNSIRLKSLGEDYSEQSLRNRISDKRKFENNIDNKIKTIDNPDIAVMYKTVKHYTIVFAQGVLPVKKKNPKKPFTWTNDAEIDKLSELNKKINSGATLTGIRNEFSATEKSVSEKKDKFSETKKELKFYSDLFNAGVRCFKNNESKKGDMEFLTKHKITAENYHKIESLVVDSKKEVTEIESDLSGERNKLRDISDILSMYEKIASGTYVQSLVEEEIHRRQSEIVKNGLKRA